MRELFSFPNPVNEKAARTVAGVVLILFVPAAALESIAGYCVGCKVFGLLMRAGVVPETVCAECADVRPATAGRR
jgi:hypothetical protein